MDIDRSDWGVHWLELEARATALLLPLMSAAGRRRARSELRMAAEVAQNTPIALIHGDLGGTNILVDGSLSAVTGVVDWDSARLGDPAIDLAAVTARLDAELREALLNAAPMFLKELPRAHAYRATFALQEALFGAEQDDDRALAIGLADYRS